MSGSGNDYSFYQRNPPPSAFTVRPDGNWNNWHTGQQQHQPQFGSYNDRRNYQNLYSNNISTNNLSMNLNLQLRTQPQNYFNANNNRHYPQADQARIQQNVFHSPSPPAFKNQYHGRPYSATNNNTNYNNKRPRNSNSFSDGSEPRNNVAKKKKKPLSQHNCTKKEWTTEEAERALAVEKEYNKRYKNQTLIIKFPDLELTRDIVSKYHPAIENVHFQQPSTPRFCFVTLQDGVNPEDVIQDLNKVQFGSGCLVAEYKREREEEQSVTPDDIDPYTLYVGNLAQEVTKEDMVKNYPTCKRIDIGYAKKMKYTRYAFVSFKNAEESIQAFKDTHNTQMYSKSLIVRFRRLHGTIGMPGEAKATKSKNDNASISDNSTLTSSQPSPQPSTTGSGISEITQPSINGDATSTTSTRDEESTSAGSPPENAPESKENSQDQVDLSLVKEEAQYSEEEDEEVVQNVYLAGDIDKELQKHKPIKTEAVEPKTEPNDAAVKEEHEDDADDAGNDLDDDPIAPVNFRHMLHQLEDHSNQIDSLRRKVS